MLRAQTIVDKVVFVQEPYKKANRRFNPDDLVIDVSGHKIGGGFFSVIAGPCSVESKAQMISIANSVKSSGAGMMRGGAFKPRSSPYSFQGMGAEGLKKKPAFLL
jgi:3-deoxy-7-phosphoheptulonate synthase